MESNYEDMYDLEIGKIINEIKKADAKLVLLQFPDGLKQKSKEIVDGIEEKTKAKCLLWLGTCFGACDIPVLLFKKPDLIIQFGHNKFIKNPLGWAEGKK